MVLGVGLIGETGAKSVPASFSPIVFLLNVKGLSNFAIGNDKMTMLGLTALINWTKRRTMGMATNENGMVELCLSIATQAHKGQTDKVGLPVILHPLTVGLMGKTPEEMCVGFLHDTIEDTSTTKESLLASGVSEPIVEAVALLSHDKAVPYFDYIESLIASGNRLALAVKRNDLTHNHGRAVKYGFKAQEEKCARALAMIGGSMQGAGNR